MAVNHLALTIQEDKQRHASHPKVGSSLPADTTKDIEPDNLGFIAQLRFEPVHDRLGKKTSRSEVGVKFQNNRLAGTKIGL